MDTAGVKRKAQTSANGPHKAPKLSRSTGEGTGGKMSFAQRMMAKMGYVEGQGLGRDGEGIVKPIEVKLRPQGAGVGTVKEKTKQAKDEERRRATMRGEEYEDSSDEEKKRRKARQQRGAAGARQDLRSNGVKKQKYRTIADVQAAAPGLEVPQTMLSSILDLTGKDQKLLTSSAGLMTIVPAQDETTAEREKIEKREALELEAFIDAWHGLQERKVYLEEHEGHHAVEIAQLEDDLDAMTKLTTAIDGLSTASAAETWSDTVAKLKQLQELRELHSVKDDLHEAAVAALSRPFQQQLNGWNVETEPSMLAADMAQITEVLGRKEDHLIDQIVHHEDDEGPADHTQTSTAYETMLFTLWLPSVRRYAQSWNVQQYQPMIDLVQAWKPVLPPFITTTLFDQIVVPRLIATLQDWDPGSRHRSSSMQEPSLWLFPWLPLLPPYQLDIEEQDSLANEIRRKLRSLLSHWRISSGLMPGLATFKDLPGMDIDHLLVKYLLPRLASYLARELGVDSVEHDAKPLEDVLVWELYFNPAIMARLLVAEFFPKIMLCLHHQLTKPNADLSGAYAWLEMWKRMLPDEMNATADVRKGWSECSELLTSALQLLESGQPLSSLRAPAYGPSRSLAHKRERKESSKPSQATNTAGIDYREVLEAWCAENDLTLLPMREAHATSGQPLLRITASVTGRGGVIAYVKGDILWAQRKSDRNVFEPIDLGPKLVERAEGR